MQEEIRVVIIEDEHMWLKGIAATLSDFGYTVAGTAESFEKAVKILSSADYDIVLVDIHLDAKASGIELGKMLSGYYNKPFIFITGSTGSHVLTDAIDAKPSAYLIKPVHPSSLIATIQSAINNFSTKTAYTEHTAQSQNSFFFVKHGNKYRKIDWTNVVYLRSDKNYTIIYNEADKTEHYIRSTLSKTLNFIIPPHLKTAFAQVNRAEAVQLSHILELAGEEVRTAYKTFTLTDAYDATLRKAINVIV